MTTVPSRPRKPFFTWWLVAGILTLAIVAIPVVAQQAQDNEQKQAADGKEQRLEQIQKQLQDLLKAVQDMKQTETEIQTRS
jgi:Tfp pilus assembly protein PilN